MNPSKSVKNHKWYKVMPIIKSNNEHFNFNAGGTQNLQIEKAHKLVHMLKQITIFT